MRQNATKLSLFKPEPKDIFSRTELDPTDKILFSPELQSMIEEAVVRAVAKIKMPEPKPAMQIIRETRVETPKKDDRDLVERSTVNALEKKIAELEAKLKETDRVAKSPMFVPGGSGVIGIPPPEGNEGKTLKVVNGKAVWITVTGGGGASISGYTINDGTTLKDLPADASVDDLRQVLGTLLTELQA